MVVLFALSMLHLNEFNRSKQTHLFYFTIASMVLSAFYFFSFVFHLDKDHFFEFQKRIGFILIPISVLLFKELNRKVYLYAFIGFAIQILILDAYTLIKTLFFYLEHNSLPFYNGDIGQEEVLPLHRPYLAFLNGLFFLISFHLFLKKIKPLLMLGLMLLTMGTIYLISARAGFAVAWLVALLGSILHFKWNIKFAFVVGGIMSILMFLIFFNSNLKKRISESFTYEPRTAIWPCAYSAIIENPTSILFGYGSEVVAQEKLNACYIETSKINKKWFWFYDTKLHVTYNTHNVYLEYWLAFGIIALIVLMTMFVMPIVASYKYNHILLFSITLFIAFNFIFENYLSRQVGIYSSFMILALLLRTESLTLFNQKNDKVL
jgi:O-antigen ligase